MDWVSISARMKTVFHKYKYVGLVLLLGVILMTMPSKQEPAEKLIPQKSEEPKLDISKQLEATLRSIEGVGEVSVFLTEVCSEETVYQTDVSQSSSENGGNSRIDTVLISNSNRNQTGLVRKVISPVYLGAIVVCQGGNHPAVRLAVTEAVANATGLKTDRISVLKMK